MKQRVLELRQEVEKGRMIAKEEGKRTAYWPKKLKLEIVEGWKNSGVNQAEFAKQVRVSPASLSAWTQGRSLELHACWRKIENESKNIEKSSLSPRKQRNLKKEGEGTEVQSAFLTFEVSDSPEKRSKKANLDFHFEHLEQEQSSLLGGSYTREPIGVLFPSGVKVSIPSQHPELLSMFKFFMEIKEGGCDV